MNNLITVAICHSDLDERFYVKMPTIPRIGERVGFMKEDEWIVGKIESIVYECEWADDDIKEMIVVELYITGKL
jgi:hypothetical protein